MNLLSFCQNITSTTYPLLPPNHRLGSRLVCPEYSKSAQEVKNYPPGSSGRLFALCWYFDGSNCLRSTLCPSPQPFSYEHFFSDQEKTQLHTHAYVELGYVVKGSFKQKILHKDITFQEGDFCLIDTNCLHQDYLEASDAVILFLGIENSMFTEIMDENITTEKIISFLQTALTRQKELQQYLHFHPIGNAKEKMEDYLFMLLKELHQYETGSIHICKGLLQRIFRLLSSEYEFSLSKEQKKTMNWILYEEICEYIQNHYRTVSIQELQQIFHFQEDYFNRLFKKKTGKTYSSYLQEIRLKEAERLLISTNGSISDIAQEVGYQNKGFFYKIFQEKYGMTPSRYRKHSKLPNKI